MTQIHPYSLWLGHAGEDRDLRRLFEEGIQAMVDLAMEEPPAHPPREMMYFRLPLLDGASNRGEVLFLAISTTAALLKMRLPTLVICGGGVSRSPAVAAAALSMVSQKPLRECLQHISQHHAHDVSPGLWNEVAEVMASCVEEK